MTRLFTLSALTMVAFAANSILNRMALADGTIGPTAFAAIRVASGALALWLLVRLRQGRLPRPGFSGPASLALYLLGFSFAYLSLDAGVGALILFGGVQITMFAGALLSRETMPPARWAGAGIAFTGLVWLLWPEGNSAPDLIGTGLMAAAAVGWGIYSLIGRGARDPLATTAVNFVTAMPIVLLALLLLPDDIAVSPAGIGLAVLSGVVTSGLGYALWYSVLPELRATRAAVAQLTVPVIAAAGGVLLLGEGLSWRFVFASVLVLGGVALSVRR